MKVLNGEIFVAIKPLEELLKQKLPVKVSYGLAKLAIKINTELKAIEEVRIGLVKKYGTTGKDDEINIKPGDLNWVAFAKEFDELMSTESEIVFEKVKIPEKITGVCDKCGHNLDVCLQIEPNTLISLQKFIDVE